MKRTRFKFTAPKETHQPDLFELFEANERGYLGLDRFDEEKSLAIKSAGLRRVGYCKKCCEFSMHAKHKKGFGYYMRCINGCNAEIENENNNTR